MSRHFLIGCINVKPALADVSDSSEELWGLVLSETTKWYAAYPKARSPRPPRLQTRTVRGVIPAEMAARIKAY